MYLWACQGFALGFYRPFSRQATPASKLAIPDITPECTLKDRLQPVKRAFIPHYIPLFQHKACRIPIFHPLQQSTGNWNN